MQKSTNNDNVFISHAPAAYRRGLLLFPYKSQATEGKKTAK